MRALIGTASNTAVTRDVRALAWARTRQSELPLSELMVGRCANLVAGELGKFGCTPAEMMDLLAGKQVSVDTDIRPFSREIGGYCAPRDLETLLKMLHLLFTQEIAADATRMQVRAECVGLIALSASSPRSNWCRAVARRRRLTPAARGSLFVCGDTIRLCCSICVTTWQCRAGTHLPSLASASKS